MVGYLVHQEIMDASNTHMPPLTCSCMVVFCNVITYNVTINMNLIFLKFLLLSSFTLETNEKVDSSNLQVFRIS